MATIDVKDAAGATVAIEKPLAPARAAAAASRPVVLSTEDKAALDLLATQATAAAILAKIIAAPSTEAKQDAVITALGLLGAQTTLAAVLAKLIAAPATEEKQDTGNTSLSSIDGKFSTLNGLVDGLEALVGSTNTALSTIDTRVDGLESLITTLNGFVDGLEALAAAATPAGSAIIGKVDHTTTGGGHGKKTVTTAGTDVVLASSTAAKWVTIQAYRANTAMIAVGGTGVDAAAANGDGVTLAAGETITLPIDNLADVFIDSTVNGEGVRYTYGT